MTDSPILEKQVEQFKACFTRIRDEMARMMVGQEEIVEGVLVAFFAGGHVLLEGVPGLGKTMLVRTLAEAVNLKFARVQFTQHRLEQPFLVLATQNPLEQEGTYPLPEAQLDRFFFKLKVNFPTAEDLHIILDRTTKREHPTIEKVLADSQEVIDLREVVRQVPLTKEVQSHAIDLVLGTHPNEKQASPLAKKYVRYGASPRGAQALILAGKIYALLDNRYHVSRADIDKAAPAALRHRIILNFEGEAEGTSTDEVIAELLTRTVT